MRRELTLLAGRTLRHESARLELPLSALQRACEIQDPDRELEDNLTLSVFEEGGALVCDRVTDAGIERPNALMKCPPSVQQSGHDRLEISTGVFVLEVANSLLDPAMSIDRVELSTASSVSFQPMETDVRLLVETGAIQVRIDGRALTAGRGDVVRVARGLQLDLATEAACTLLFVSTPRRVWGASTLEGAEANRPKALMQAPSGLYSAADAPEFFKEVEKCYVSPVANHPDDPAASLVRVRVETNGQTSLHALEVDERYIITQGRGLMQLGNESFEVGPEDVVLIPKGTPQRISNQGSIELEIYCACTPRFLKTDYVHLE